MDSFNTVKNIRYCILYNINTFFFFFFSQEFLPSKSISPVHSNYPTCDVKVPIGHFL